MCCAVAAPSAPTMLKVVRVTMTMTVTMMTMTMTMTMTMATTLCGCVVL